MKLISLTQGKFVKIDNSDLKKVSKIKWCFRKQGDGKGGYAVGHIPGTKNKVMKLHHFILDIVGKKIIIDHKNLDKLDCQRKNLRISNKQLNAANIPKLQQKFKPSSKFKGVSFMRNRNKCWRSYIVFNGKQKCLGYFEKETEAALKYNIQAQKYFGDSAYLNVIDGEN